jgi:hypothetical protein
VGYGVWYHGTRREHVAGIRANGLRAKYYGDDFQGFGYPYLTLSRNKGQAPLPERNVVMIFHVPDEEESAYLAVTENGLEAGLRKPLPPHDRGCRGPLTGQEAAFWHPAGVPKAAGADGRSARSREASCPFLVRSQVPALSRPHPSSTRFTARAVRLTVMAPPSRASAVTRVVEGKRLCQCRISFIALTSMDE